MADEEYTCLKSLPVAVLPNLNENCVESSLVMLEGSALLENELNCASYNLASR